MKNSARERARESARMERLQDKRLPEDIYSIIQEARREQETLDTTNLRYIEVVFRDAFTGEPIIPPVYTLQHVSTADAKSWWGARYGFETVTGWLAEVSMVLDWTHDVLKTTTVGLIAEVLIGKAISALNLARGWVGRPPKSDEEKDTLLVLARLWETTDQWYRDYKRREAANGRKVSLITQEEFLEGLKEEYQDPATVKKLHVLHSTGGKISIRQLQRGLKRLRAAKK
jgi:hypothetical protein